MGVIFLISSRLLKDAAAFDATERLFGSLNYVVRKLAHVAEYAILAYFWFRSIWTRRDRFGVSVRWSVVLTVAYAITDELHQATVPMRSGAWTDVVIDGAGAILMALALIRVERTGNTVWRRRLLGQPAANGGVADERS